MMLKQFVESFCADTAEITVTIMPMNEVHRSYWIELHLGRGAGDLPGCRSRPALERYRSAALAELVCVCPAARPGEIELLAQTDWKNITLLAAQIERGDLAGCVI